MAEFFASYGLFLLKTLTLVIAIVIVVFACVAMASRGKHGHGDSKGHIEVEPFNKRLENMEHALSWSLLEEPARKLAEKSQKTKDKADAKAAKQAAKRASRQRGKGETIVPEAGRRRVFVLDFDGDIRATEVDKLRREITAVLTTATSDDEIVLRLESGGGMVTSYGLGASQLDRIREARVPLTICVDKVAASGGYMMACVADRIIAAPFAVLGSIGVVAQIPNLHRLLKELNIDFEILTAGKYKRTLTIFGENTDEGRQKFLQDIERIHAQFKEYVDERRPKLDIEQVATGEIWSGQDALDLHLADTLQTSDAYLVDACEDADVVMIKYKEKKKLIDRLSIGVQNTIDGALMRWLDRLANSKYSVGG